MVRFPREILAVFAGVFGVAVFFAVAVIPIAEAPRAKPRTRVLEPAIIDRLETLAASASTHPPEMVFITIEHETRLHDRLASVFGHTRRELEIGAALLAGDEARFDEGVAAAFAGVTGTTKASAAASARALALSGAALTSVGRGSQDATSAKGVIAVVLAALVGHAAVWPARATMGASLATAERARAAAVSAYLGRPRAAGEAAGRAALEDYLARVCRPLLDLDLLPTDALVGLARWASDAEDADWSAPEGADQPDALARLLVVMAGEDAFRPHLRRHTWSVLVQGELVGALRQRARDDIAAWPGAAPVSKKPVRALRWFIAALDEGRASELVDAVNDSRKARHPGRPKQSMNASLATSLAGLLASAVLFRGGELLDPIEARRVALTFEGDEIHLFDLANRALSSSAGTDEVRAWVDRLSAPRRPPEEGV